MLSPLEKAVLATCDHDRTAGEVQADLAPIYEPHQVRHALVTLRRMQLLEHDAEASSLDPHRLFRQTQAGVFFLRRQRVQEAGETLSPGGLRLVAG
jgi:hypothetical protein